MIRRSVCPSTEGECIVLEILKFKMQKQDFEDFFFGFLTTFSVGLGLKVQTQLSFFFSFFFIFSDTNKQVLKDYQSLKAPCHEDIQPVK